MHFLLDKWLKICYNRGVGFRNVHSRSNKLYTEPTLRDSFVSWFFLSSSLLHYKRGKQMLKVRRGRPRKVGKPTRGTDGALKRRYYRALVRARRGDKLIAKHRNDMFNYYDYLISTNHKTCLKVAIKVKQDIDYYLGDQLMTVKTAAEKSAETKAINLAEKYSGIIESLQKGEENADYTLLPVAKAKTNATVKHLVDVDKVYALCEYKK